MRVLWLRCFNVPSLHRETTNFFEHIVYPMIACLMIVFRLTCPISSTYVLNYIRQIETYVLNCTHVLYWKYMRYKWEFYDYDALICLRCIERRPILFEYVVYPMITCSMTAFRHACPISSTYVLNYIRQVETYVLSCTRVLYWKNVVYKWGLCDYDAMTCSRSGVSTERTFCVVHTL